MVRKTRRQTKQTRSKVEGAMTIPELRRAFEHIEDVIHDCHTSGDTKEETIKHIRKEWMRTFRKELSKASAEKLVMNHTASHRKRGTRKRGGGGALGYAPVGYQTRPGDYSYSSQGGMGDYFSKGISVTVPESGMTEGTWPTPDKSLGSNQFIPMKGGRRGVRRNKGGALSWSTLDAAFTRPVGGSSPPGVLFDAQTMMKGQQVGSSSNLIQNSPNYQATMNPKLITF